MPIQADSCQLYLKSQEYEMQLALALSRELDGILVNSKCYLPSKRQDNLNSDEYKKCIQEYKGADALLSQISKYTKSASQYMDKYVACRISEIEGSIVEEGVKKLGASID